MRIDNEIKSSGKKHSKRLPVMTDEERKKSEERKPISRKQGVGKHGLWR